MKIRTIIATTCAALAFSMAGPIYAHDSEAQTVTKNFEAAIPNIPGKSLIAVEVDYAPGAASVPHIHAKSAFIYAYVISGAIESKVNDGETRIYRAGESWSEPPNALHSISRNASKTEPAKLLAVFVLDTNDNYHTVWTGTDTTPPGLAAPFRVSWEATSYLVKGVRIHVGLGSNWPTLLFNRKGAVDQALTSEGTRV